MANLFLAGNHLALVLRRSHEARALHQAAHVHQNRALIGLLWPTSIRGFASRKFIFALVDNYAAGLQ
jgi:hypothetical protein